MKDRLDAARRDVVLHRRLVAGPCELSLVEVAGDVEQRAWDGRDGHPPPNRRLNAGATRVVGDDPAQPPPGRRGHVWGWC